MITYKNKNYDSIHFIHINKCAGSSTKKWLEKNKIQHGTKTARSCDHYIPEQFRDATFYFTIVRNPYNRVASHYFQWERNNFLNEEVKDLKDFVNLLSLPDALARPKILNSHTIGRHSTTPLNDNAISPKFNKPCSHWIRDFNKVKVFKFEQLSTLQDFFQENYFDILKYDITTTFVENTKTKGLKSYSHLYDQEMIEIVNKVYSDDFINFNYTKL